MFDFGCFQVLDCELMNKVQSVERVMVLFSFFFFQKKVTRE
jgi:hypothetical protein